MICTCRSFDSSSRVSHWALSAKIAGLSLRDSLILFSCSSLSDSILSESSELSFLLSSKEEADFSSSSLTHSFPLVRALGAVAAVSLTVLAGGAWQRPTQCCVD